MSSGLSDLWRDLRRRRVFQVAALYAAGAWVIVQVADVVGPAINMPAWVMTAIVGFAMVGFPIAVILAWLFDVDKDGVHRTKPGSATGVLAIATSIGLLGAGTAGFVWLIKPGDSDLPGIASFEPLANSVAVMPFVNLSAGKDSEYFTDGIAEVLIHQLSAIAKLKVIASKSSFAFDRGDTDYMTIARMLRAEKLLVGSVQRSGNKLRIAAQLIDSHTGQSIWSELFDRDNTDIFAIQDEIALAVAEKMNAPLEPAVKARVIRPISDDVDAYELYLRAGQVVRNTQIDDGYAEAIQYLEQAVEKDPNLALAWAGLGSATFWHGTRGHIPFDEALSKSREYNARALELDPELGEAYAHKGFVTANVDGDLDVARQFYAKAMEFSPGRWQTYLGYGITLNNYGRHSEAIEVLEMGMELQPFKPEALLVVNLGSSYALSGEHEKAMRLVGGVYEDRKGTNLEGQYIHWMAGTALRSNRFDEAVACFEIAVRDGHESFRRRAELGRAYLAIGDLIQAQRHVELAESAMDEELAKGRSVAHPVFFVQLSRLFLNIANNDVDAMLTNAKELEKKLAANAVYEWAWWDIYRAAVIYIVLGDYEAGARLMDRLLETERDAENFALAAFAHGQIGNDEKARQYVTEGRAFIEKHTRDRQVTPEYIVWIAMFYAVDGDADRTIAELQRAYDAGYREHAYLAYMPLFDSVRNDTRFVGIIRQMRADTNLMRDRVDKARASGDWESLIARHMEP